MGFKKKLKKWKNPRSWDGRFESMLGSNGLHTKEGCQIHCSIFNYYEALITQSGFTFFFVTICDLKSKQLNVLHGKLEETIYALT